MSIDWNRVADLINRLRIFPRLIMVSYGLLVWLVVEWSMIQPIITSQHSNIILAIIGIASFLVPAYFMSGNSKDK